MSSLVLVVEDDFLIGEQIRFALQDGGFDVIGPAESAEEAQTLLAGRTPAVAVLDIRIKGDLDGIELARRLKSERSIGVVFLTGSGEPETRRRALEVGDAFLMKPFHEEALLAEIRALLDAAPSDLQPVAGAEHPGDDRKAEAEEGQRHPKADAHPYV